MNQNGIVTLTEALKIAKHSLVDGSVEYQWEKISQDNVGILAQAITRTDRVSLFNEYLKDIVARVAKRRRKPGHIPTWTEMVAEYWPMTGAPIAEIFMDMSEAGVKRSDIHDLEYLTGKINLLTDIKKERKTIEIEFVRREKVGIWPFRKERDQIYTQDKEYEFYQLKENLLKYYDAWEKNLRDKPAGGSGGTIIVDGETYPYRNSFQLARLKDHFLTLENYKGVDIVVKELEKYKK